MQYYLSPYPGVQICELQQCMHIDITHKLKIYNQHFDFIEYFANQEKYQLQMKIAFYGYGYFVVPFWHIYTFYFAWSVRKIEGARLLSVILFPVFRYFLDVCYLKSSKLTLFLYLTDLLQKILSATNGLKTECGRLQLRTRNTNEATVKITSRFLQSPRVHGQLGAQ